MAALWRSPSSLAPLLCLSCLLLSVIQPLISIVYLHRFGLSLTPSVSCLYNRPSFLSRLMKINTLFDFKLHSENYESFFKNYIGDVKFVNHLEFIGSA